MPQDQDLNRLLASIDPQLQPGAYAFCALDPHNLPSGLNIQMLFRESEATTLVVPLAEASARNLVGAFACEWITLGVSSDLAAVGFLAEVTARLAAAGISANVVSAYHHDHLFVPIGRGDEEMAGLRELQSQHHDNQR